MLILMRKKHGALRGVPAGWGSGKIKILAIKVDCQDFLFCSAGRGSALQVFLIMRFGRFLQLQQGF